MPDVVIQHVVSCSSADKVTSCVMLHSILLNLTLLTVNVNDNVNVNSCFRLFNVL